MLEVRDLTVRFDETTAVAAASLSLDAGRVGAVIGPSGCGKSTLLRAIAGLQRPDAGSVCWNGSDVTDQPAHTRRFGLMFQDYALFPHLDVAANVGFGLRFSAGTAEDAATRVEHLLELVGLPDHGTRTIDGLSGGEQQRVALARTLAPSPDLVMLDEPLGALDRALRDELLPEMRRIFGTLGTTVLYVTHDHDEAFAIADTIFVMRSGVIVGHGSPEEMWDHPPDAETARFLGFEPIVAAPVNGGEIHLGFVTLPCSMPEGSYEVALSPGALAIDGSGRIEATVQDARYTTDGYVLEVRVGDLDVTVRSARSVDPGRRIRLTLDATRTVMYPRS